MRPGFTECELRASIIALQPLRQGRPGKQVARQHMAGHQVVGKRDSLAACFKNRSDENAFGLQGANDAGVPTSNVSDCRACSLKLHASRVSLPEDTGDRQQGILDFIRIDAMRRR